MALGNLGRLSDEDLTNALELASKADSVELKLTVPASDHRATAVALGLDPLEAQIRQVYFFDTPDLALNAAGVVVRARRVQGRQGDTVVKLRPVQPDDLPDHLRRSAAMVVEVDAMPGGYVCSASLKGRASASEINEAAAGNTPLKRLFSKEQRAFYRSHAPADLTLDSLSVLGPIFVLKQNLEVKKLQRRMVAELWLYPDGSRILELSTKCASEETAQVAVEARAYLVRKGVDLEGRQETKTKRALTYFSKQLSAAG